jgi:redox-sensitive bicupin YhaK (pirin superfamily)
MKHIIERVLPSFEVEMDGLPILQPLPTTNVEQIDPFLLLHHASIHVEAGADHKHAGVGPHPHRGFSPVTFVFQGEVHHRDSRGNSSVVREGGVQWMDVGMGIIHSERPSKEFAERGGSQEIIQLWINSAAANKMDQPQYFAREKEEMPEVAGLKGDVRIVAGDFQGKKGAINSKNVKTVLMGKLAEGDRLNLNKTAGQNAILYILDGTGFLKGFGLIEHRTLYSLVNAEVNSVLEARNNLKFIYLSAEPIKEKVEHYGPFVMNNQTEIMEAMRDYQMGKMGFLVEEDFE